MDIEVSTDDEGVSERPEKQRKKGNHQERQRNMNLRCDRQKPQQLISNE